MGTGNPLTPPFYKARDFYALLLSVVSISISGYQLYTSEHPVAKLELSKVNDCVTVRYAPAKRELSLEFKLVASNSGTADGVLFPENARLSDVGDSNVFVPFVDRDFSVSLIAVPAHSDGKVVECRLSNTLGDTGRQLLSREGRKRLVVRFGDKKGAFLPALVFDAEGLGTDILRRGEGRFCPGT